MDTYEKKYNEAQKWIESIYSELSHEQQLEAEAFFPELRESEDERVRKEILSLVRYTKGRRIGYEPRIHQDKMITWLEKQGEQKVPVVDFKAKDWYVSKVDGKIHNIYNSVDKVEPKFHKSDWITNGDYTLKIVEVKPLDYILQSQDGNIVDDTISHVDEQFHSFTIEDAKDGDVLACPLPKGYEDREQIFIFKGINSRDYVDNCIEYYCRICDGVFYENENGYMGTTSSPIYPATKEQRDTLLKAMTDAGWEFDFEKKELKKIDDNEVKGRDDVLRCIDPDEMVADFCSQPLSMTRSLASIYRQGIIDIIKRINRNEKTSIIGTRNHDDGGVR